MSIVKTQPCIACTGIMRYETRADKVEYKGYERVINTLAWWCTTCAEAILAEQPLADRERAFIDLKAQVDAADLRKAAVQEAADEVFTKHAGAFTRLAE
jgi:hypothetical protein